MLLAGSAGCDDSGPAASTCPSGRESACTCADGGSGTQICDARGEPGPCRCDRDGGAADATGTAPDGLLPGPDRGVDAAPRDARSPRDGADNDPDAVVGPGDSGRERDTLGLMDAKTDGALPDGGSPDALPTDVWAPDGSRPDATLPDAVGPRPWIVETPIQTIPAGWFVRGSRHADDDEDQRPIRGIWVDRFTIDRDEVSVEAYAACVEQDLCTAPSEQDPLCTWLRRDQAGNLPVNCVDFEQAGVYCEAVGKTLPTEAEWEKAARGGCELRGTPDCELVDDDVMFPWGTPMITCQQVRTRLCPDWETGPQPVWWRSPDGDSIYRVRNLSGNVREWVVDAYDAHYYADSRDLNPLRRRAISPRVVRGAGYDSGGSRPSRTTYRAAVDPASSRPDIGFRCVQPSADRGIGGPDNQVDEFEGILRDVPQENLDAWTLCSTFAHGEAFDLDQIAAAACIEGGAQQLLVGCRLQRTLEYQLLAMGAPDEILQPTPAAGREVNGLLFYRTDDLFGFAPVDTEVGCGGDHDADPLSLCVPVVDGVATGDFSCGGRGARYEWVILAR